MAKWKRTPAIVITKVGGSTTKRKKKAAPAKKRSRAKKPAWRR